MTENKITKRHIVNAIIALAESDANIEVDVDGVVVTSEDIKAFGETWLDQADKKNASAAKRNAKKRAESDELADKIYDVIADAGQAVTPDEIVAALDEDGVTKSKVTARVSKLVKADKVDKVEIKVDGSKRVAYVLPEAE